MANVPIEIPSGAWDFDRNNYPDHEATQITTTRIVVTDWFDDTTEEFLVANVEVPTNIDLTGTVNFRTHGRGKAPDGNEVQLCFYHSMSEDGNTLDDAYTAEKSGDFNVLTTTHLTQLTTWSETVSNLGWTAGSFLKIRLSRCAIVGGTDLVGDYGVSDFKMLIPTS